MAAANLVSSGAGSPLVESTFGSERGLKIDGGEGGGGLSREWSRAVLPQRSNHGARGTVKLFALASVERHIFSFSSRLSKDCISRGFR